jgi:hypothetical protein
LRVRQLEDRLVPSTLFVDPTGIGPGGVSAYTTIQAAVNAAKAGSTIVVDPATYTEDVTIAQNGISLDGAQAGVNPVPGRSGSESILKGSVTITGTNVAVDGFTVDSTEQWAIEVGGITAVVPHAVISDNIVDATTYGIQLGSENGFGTQYSIAQDNVVTNAAATIALFGGSYNVVQGNALSQPNLIGIDNYYANNTQILGNTINNAPGDAIRLRGGSDDCVIVNNSGSGNTGSVDLENDGAGTDTALNNNFTPTGAPNNPTTSTLYVDPSGVGPGGLTAYKTIQAAIRAATAGTAIIVDAATYTQNVTIGKRNIALLGAQAGIDPVPGRSGAESSI